MMNMVDLTQAEFDELCILVKTLGRWRASMFLDIAYPTLRRLVERDRPMLSFAAYDRVMAKLANWRERIKIDTPTESTPRCACGEALAADEPVDGDCLLCRTVEQHLAKYLGRNKGRESLLKIWLDAEKTLRKSS